MTRPTSEEHLDPDIAALVRALATANAQRDHAGVIDAKLDGERNEVDKPRKRGSRLRAVLKSPEKRSID